MASLFKNPLAHLIVIAVTASAGLYVFATAPRKVTIPIVPTNGLDLHNGSGASVTYKVTCYNKAGNQLFQKTGQTLVSNQSTNYGGSIRCADGQVAQTGLGTNNDYKNGMVKCPNAAFTNVVSNATNYCGSNYSICTYSQFQNNKPTSIPWDDYGWFSYSGTGFSASSSTASNWSYKYSSTGSWQANYDNEVPYGHYSSNANYYFCNSSLTGAGTTFNDCGSTYYGTNSVYCCPAAGAEQPANSCAVEIESSTSADGYLQSPQFKSSSPF